MDLTYSLSPRWPQSIPDHGCDEIGPEQLHYSLFLGDIMFRVGGTDFSARWDWIPLLDFALGLRRIAHRLPATGHGEFDFTESEARFEFHLTNSDLEITSNFGPGPARVPYGEFATEVERFAAEMLADFDKLCPGLSHNPEVKRMLETE